MSPDLTALLALLISAFVACWNLGRYLLEGGRVRVRMSPGLQVESGLKQDSTWKRLEKNAGPDGWPIEVAILEVENLGRTAVTLSGPSLDFGRTRWWRFGRYRVAPPRLASVESCIENRVRLEPFDSVQWVFDIWHILDTAPSRGSGPSIRIRGSIRVAGKRNMRRSPWGRGWRVVKEQSTFLSTEPEMGLVAYRSIWRRSQKSSVVSHLHNAAPIAIEIRKKFPKEGQPPSVAELLDIISGIGTAGDWSSGKILARYLNLDLKKYYANGDEEFAELAVEEVVPGESK